ATIVIEIDDDVPNAVDDSESVSESATDPVSGNVLDNDLHGNGQSGADTPTSLVSWGPETAQYGTITQNADGSYSYTLNNSNADVQGLDDGETLTETFTYTMQDADGDERSATLTITITGENDGPEIEVDPGNPEGANDVVSESGLSTGSAAATDSEFAGGTFTLSDADGLDDIESVTINGTVIAIADLGNNNVIAGDHGILTVTSYDPSTGIATYTYELTSATTDVDGVVETDEFSLTVSDGTAESAPATIVIEIEDDLPKAIPDTDKVVAGDIATGNVVTGIDVPGGDSNSEDGNADVFGADGQNAGGAVVGVYSDNLGTDGTVGTSFAGQYGSLTINADGSYTYVANEDVPGGGTEVFTYTIQDGDGDTTTAELTINVRDANEEGILIVGSNDDDVPGATTPYVEAPQGSGPGPIEGSDVSDILSGDSGGSTSQAALANIILILDTSGSMDEKIQFTDADGNTSLITRFEALQKAVINLLNQLANGTADQVRVHIVDYDTNAQAIGTFDLIGGSGLADAIAAINALVLGGWTNYEAGLQLALDWANGLTAIDPLTGANVVNQAFFISDGEPNRALNGNSTDINNDTGQISATASLQHILGTGSGDSVSEVAALEAAFGPIEAIGINVGATAENILDQVEGSGGDADNIDTANELIDVLAELNPLLNLA
ncbi:MAG TPA: hypothetical protein DCZ13_05785, partial [Porticoccaceae bacterium]|nr:hypothetical protein [Porticoccaceae bacterium]